MGRGVDSICRLFVLLCSHLMQHNSLYVMIVLLLLYGMRILLVLVFHLLQSFIA
jgi:hypothetical protein